MTVWPTNATPSERRREATWTNSAKDGAGTALNPTSRVWFTLLDGAMTEVYYPRVDRANIRQLRLVATGPDGLWVEGDSSNNHDHSLNPRARVVPLATWVPAYEVDAPCSASEGLRVIKTVITDVDRSVVLQRVRLVGKRSGSIALYVLLEPHLGNQGEGNDAWLGDYKGARGVFARCGDTSLALLASRSFCSGACTYAGTDDALSDLRTNRRLTVRRPSAPSGNLQIAAELELGDGAECVLALGFGRTPEQAAQQARASLLEDFDALVARYVGEWRDHRDSYPAYTGDGDAAIAALHDTSVAMLRVHRDKECPGATIASMAIPWGNAHGDHDRGGYHLVWPRDLVEAAGALAAVGLVSAARDTLLYLMSTQEASGEWPQNMWLDGTAQWRGMQLDEIGLPILLASTLAREDALDGLDPWAMIRRAAAFLVQHGPCTPEDRWEESPGYSPYTIATIVAALVAAADVARDRGFRAVAAYLLDTADYWNSSIERWMYVTGTEKATIHGVHGYYVRLTPPSAVNDVESPNPQTPLSVKNQRCASQDAPYQEIVSPDALGLVRFGLRSATDPRIRDTLTVIDAELMTVTSRGPVWHRFTNDGYGETPKGDPFIRWGCGRGWPLLAGERAHVELAANRIDRARELRRTMAAQASETGMLPEQVWDVDDIPDRALFNGQASGSAMPLVWTHAEFLKLCRSIDDGRIFDTPPESAARYADAPHGGPKASVAIWHAGHRPGSIEPGQRLRVQAPTGAGLDAPGGTREGSSGEIERAPASEITIEWSTSDSTRKRRRESWHELPELGITYVDLPTHELAPGVVIEFRLHDAPGIPNARTHSVRVRQQNEDED